MENRKKWKRGRTEEEQHLFAFKMDPHIVLSREAFNPLNVRKCLAILRFFQVFVDKTYSRISEKKGWFNRKYPAMVAPRRWIWANSIYPILFRSPDNEERMSPSPSAFNLFFFANPNFRPHFWRFWAIILEGDWLISFDVVWYYCRGLNRSCLDWIGNCLHSFLID